MKLAIIYDKDDHKLQDTSYSWIYKGMFDALCNKFEVNHINDDCSAQDIDAEAILFYDIQSSHHIRIDGIKQSKLPKFEYFIDPQQEEIKGVYQQFNKPVHKLGKRQRIERIYERGIDYIITPYKDGCLRFLKEYLDDEKMILHFPPAPILVKDLKPFKERKREVLANGAISDNKAYELRKWAYQQSYVTNVKHWINDKNTPSGKDYINFLSQYMASLALCDYFAVPKYFEIPMAGCLLFAQYHEEFENLGFKDYENCIFVNKDNFEKRVKDFLDDPEIYQVIADSGKKLVEENYTANNFAEFLYKKIEEMK